MFGQHWHLRNRRVFGTQYQCCNRQGQPYMLPLQFFLVGFILILILPFNLGSEQHSIQLAAEYAFGIFAGETTQSNALIQSQTSRTAGEGIIVERRAAGFKHGGNISSSTIHNRFWSGWTRRPKTSPSADPRKLVLSSFEGWRYKGIFKLKTVYFQFVFT